MLPLFFVVLLSTHLIGLPRNVVAAADRSLLAMMVVVSAVYGVSIAVRAQARARLYLVPGGVAVIRRAVRRIRSSRINVHSRTNACLVIRKVRNILLMELWPIEGKIIRRRISERDAISVAATWRSTRSPIPAERLKAMLAV